MFCVTNLIGLDFLDDVGISYKQACLCRIHRDSSFMRPPRAGIHTKRSALPG